MSLSPSVYSLKAESREETAGGFLFNLLRRAAGGEGSAGLGRGVRSAGAGAGRAGEHGAHVRQRSAQAGTATGTGTVTACRSAPPHVRPRAAQPAAHGPPERSAGSPAPCISS